MATAHATYQLRAYVSRNGHARIDDVLTLSCNLYNSALEDRIFAYNKRGESVTRHDQYRWLTDLRRLLPQYRALDVEVLRGPLKRLDLGFSAFFRRVKAGEKPGFPRFRSRRRYTCIDLAYVRPNMVRRSDDGTRAWIKVKGLPTIKVKASRPLPPSDDIKSLRIIRRPTGIYVDLVYEHQPKPLEPTGKTIGIDLGVVDRLALSDGARIAGRKLDRRRQRRLQRRLSRSKGSKKGQRKSNRFRKRARSLAREQHRNKVRNRNECHRLTSEIVGEHQLIAVEALTIPNMNRSAAGTAEEPGRNVAAKRGLNRSIQEQTWGLLRQQLAYKAEWAGREYVEVDPKYTSQRCSACGVVEAGSRKKKLFVCAACGHQDDADVNAAKNILRAGLAQAKSAGGRLAAPDCPTPSASPALAGVQSESHDRLHLVSEPATWSLDQPSSSTREPGTAVSEPATWSLDQPEVVGDHLSRVVSEPATWSLDQPPYRDRRSGREVSEPATWSLDQPRA